MSRPVQEILKKQAGSTYRTQDLPDVAARVCRRIYPINIRRWGKVPQTSQKSNPAGVTVEVDISYTARKRKWDHK
jgi:hypothetical protein